MPGEIEFLPQEDVVDEHAPPPPPRRRTPRGAWIALIAVAIVGLGAWAATRPDQAPRPSPIAIDPPAIVPSPSVSPLTVTCQSHARTDPEVVRQLRSHLRGVEVPATGELLCTRGIRDDLHVVSERITGSYRNLELVVDVSVRGSRTTDYIPYPITGRGTALMSVDTESAGVHVHIVVFGPGTATAPMLGVQHLADDLSLNLVL